MDTLFIILAPTSNASGGRIHPDWTGTDPELRTDTKSSLIRGPAGLFHIRANYFSVTWVSSPSSRNALCVSSRDCFESPSGGLTSTEIMSFNPWVAAKRESTLV